MNKSRRKELEGVLKLIEDAKAAIEALSIDDIVSELTNIRDAEEEYLENMPDSLRNGDKGSEVQDRIDNMDDAIAGLGTIVDAIESLDFDDVVSYIELAKS